MRQHRIKLILSAAGLVLLGGLGAAQAEPGSTCKVSEGPGYSARACGDNATVTTGPGTSSSSTSTSSSSVVSTPAQTEVVQIPPSPEPLPEIPGLTPETPQASPPALQAPPPAPAIFSGPSVSVSPAPAASEPEPSLDSLSNDNFARAMEPLETPKSSGGPLDFLGSLLGALGGFGGLGGG